MIRCARLISALIICAIGPLPRFSDTAAAAQSQIAEIQSALEAGQYARAEDLSRNLVASLGNSSPNISVTHLHAYRVLVEALVLNGNGARPESHAAAERAVQLAERLLAGDDPERATPPRLMASVLAESGDHVKAVEWHRRALQIAEGAIGGQSAALAPYLNGLARVLIEIDRHDEAATLLARSLRSQEPPTGDLVARTLELTAVAFHRKGAYQDARPLLERALAIRSNRPDHPALVEALNLLGDQLWFEGDLLESANAYAKALDAAKRTLRVGHPTVAVVSKNLGHAQSDLGYLEQARASREEALAIAEQNFAADHPKLAGYLVSVANGLLLDGDYGRARNLYERAVRIFEERAGPEHGNTATTVHNLAILHANIGDFAEAQNLHRRAIAAWQRSLGDRHPTVALALAEMATALRQQGLDAQARPLLVRALAIREQSLGANHPSVARSLGDLAAVESALGNVQRSQQLLRRAFAIWEGSKQSETFAFTDALIIQGTLALRNGDDPLALSAFERALALRRKVLGLFHPQVAEAGVRLAEAHLYSNHALDARKHAIEAEELSRTHLRSTLRYLPERQSLAYARTRPRGLYAAMSLLNSGPPHAEDIFSSVVNSRSLVLDEMARRRRLMNDRPEVASLWAALAKTRARFANLIVRTPDERSALHAKLVADAQREKEIAERALAEQSVAFQEELATADVRVDELRRSLPARSALISFFRYDHIETTGSTGRGTRRRYPAYTAFVLRSDSAPIIARNLGPASVIDLAIQRWRREVSTPPVSRAPGAAQQSYRTHAARLRQLVWDPVADQLGGIRTVFVVPDGPMNFVNFATLPSGTSEYLVDDDELVIHYLSAERDVVNTYSGRPAGTGLLALGGAAFGVASQGSSPSATLRSGCATLASLQFHALNGTLEEISSIHRLWSETHAADPRTRILTGEAATERAFKEHASGRRIVHLATHGFFLDGACETPTGNSRAVAGLTGSRRQNRSVRDESPLLLSGLALAGANRRGELPRNEEDGILTAEEVAALDLEGVEWAVLSACDTGVGDVQLEEGVLGLRRSFQIAGARTVIMSLWQVEDRSARDWMGALYDARLKKRLSTADAVRYATTAMLTRRRASGETTHPFYWGSFIAAGDWR